MENPCQESSSIPNRIGVEEETDASQQDLMVSSEESSYPRLVTMPSSPPGANTKDTGEESADAPALITPVKAPKWTDNSPAESKNHHHVIPSEGHDCSSCCRLEGETEALRHQLREAKVVAQNSKETVSQLFQGIKALKRIVERESDSDGSSKDSAFLHSLTDSISSSDVGAAMSGLVNAVNMVRDHSKLMSQESEDLVKDLHEARNEASQSRKRASQAEAIARKLYKRNVSLNEDVARLRNERKVLIDEVKSLRGQVDEIKMFDTWKSLNEHVQEAMMNHEQIMFAAQLKRRAELASQKPVLRDSGISTVSSFDSTDSFHIDSTSSSGGEASATKGMASDCPEESPLRSENNTSSQQPMEGKDEEKSSSRTASPTSSLGDNYEQVQTTIPSLKDKAVIETNTPSSPKARRFPKFGGIGLGFKSLMMEADKASQGVYSDAVSASATEEKHSSKVPPETVTPKEENRSAEDDDANEVDMFGPVEHSAETYSYNPVQISGHFGCKPRQKTAYPDTVTSPETCDTTVSSTQGSSRHGSAETFSDKSTDDGMHMDEKVFMPLSVTFSTSSDDDCHLATPSASPPTTPPCVQNLPSPRPICNPTILRSLSIPSSEELNFECLAEQRDASTLGAGLYEC